MGQNCQYLAKKSKSFGTHVTEKPPGHLVCIVFFVGLGTKRANNAEKANFGPNLAIFGPKILIFMRVSKSFGTNITETPMELVRIVFWSDIRSNGPKMPVLGPIWPFWGQKSIFWVDGVKLLVPSYRESNETPFSY